MQGYDALKHGATGLVADAKVALESISSILGDHTKTMPDPSIRTKWLAQVDHHCRDRIGDQGYLAIDAEVIGAVQRTSNVSTIAMCAAGTMPGALKLLWQPSQGGYHVEYGFSCMGYEVAGAMGLKLAKPYRDVICFVGDGSYMMANSELATAVMRKIPYTVVLTDNRGYGCINRLQTGTGGAAFNNLYADTREVAQPQIDYVAHAASMGAKAVKATGIADLEAKLIKSKGSDIPVVIVIETDPRHGPTDAGGGAWWDVGIPEVSDRAEVKASHADYLEHKKTQRSD